MYQSSDHSLVNDLLRAGELTEDEARDFPHKNVITRAMQPHLAKRFKADVYLFDDIKPGDYFFLCCDGVLEQLSNENLCQILSEKNLNDAEKLSKIKGICDDKTRDNYSCWLVPIDNVEIKASDISEPVILAEEVHENFAGIGNGSEVEGKSNEKKAERRYATIKIPVPNIKLPKVAFTPWTAKWLIVAAAAIILAICAFIVLNNGRFEAVMGNSKT